MNLMERVNGVLGQSDADERAGVANPRRLGWLSFLDVLAWLVAFAIAWLCVFHTPQHSYVWATLVVGAAFPVAAYLLLRRRRRARAYSRGWLDGRAQLFGSIEEALRRDMSLAEWMRTEVERDEKVIDHI